MRNTPISSGSERPGRGTAQAYWRKLLDEIWRDFPELVAGVVATDSITNDVSVDTRIAALNAIAKERLETGPEGEFPEIQAWRRAFSRMGLKPTQSRCASESVLRRYRKEGSLPRIHSLIDLCNAISLAYTIPMAVFDISQITGYVKVRHASGSERYLAFSGETEHPDEGEVIFADEAGQAHARRWTNRQSAHSAIRQPTTDVLIVAEAMHDSATDDVKRLVATLVDELNSVWSVTPTSALLSQASPRFAF